VSSRVFGAAIPIALLFLAAAPEKALAAETRTVTDAHGRAVAIGKAERIVSVGGAVTEILLLSASASGSSAST
jgi:ABC-type Fe3+-hydroxamate transport system substrate-binding protein